MLKRMISLLTVIAMILSLGITVMADTPSEVVIEAENFISKGRTKIEISTKADPSYVAPTYTDMDMPYFSKSSTNINTNPYDWEVYDVTIPESGEYDIYMYAASLKGQTMEMTVLEGATGYNVICKGTVGDWTAEGGWANAFKDWQLRTIGTGYFEKGATKLRIWNTRKSGAGGYIDYFKLVPKAEATGLTYRRTIEAEYYTSSYSNKAEVNPTKYAVSYANYIVPINPGATGYVTVFNKDEYANYDVYVAQDGLYKVGMNGLSADAVDKEMPFAIDVAGQSIVGTTYGDGSWGAPYSNHDLGYVMLHKGSNDLRITNNAGGIQPDYLYIEKAETPSGAIDLTAPTSQDDATVADGTVTISAGGSITYDVDFASMGAYELNIDADFSSFEINGASYAKGERFSINAGTHALKISADEEVSFSEANVSLYSYTKKYLATTPVASFDASAGTSFTFGSKDTSVSFNKGDWLVYEIDASVAGQYEMIAHGLTSTTGAKLELYYGDEKSANLIATATTKASTTGTWQDGYNTIGKINLGKGKNTFCVKSYGSGFVFSDFYLTNVGEANFKTDYKIEAESCFSCHDESVNENAPLLKATGLGLNKGDWAAYKIYADFEGSYSVKTYGAALTDTSILNVLSGEDDLDYIMTSGSPVDSGENWSNFSYALSTIGNINLKKGENTIRLHYPSGGGYEFDYFTLSRVGDVVYSDTYEATMANVKESYNPKTEKPLDVSGSYVSFPNNSYLKYTFYPDFAGVYEVTAYHSWPVIPVLNVANSNGTSCVAELPKIEGATNFTPTVVGQLILDKGRNEIKITNTGAQFHLQKCVLRYLGNELPEAIMEVDASMYNYENGEGVDYHENTAGLDSEDYRDFGDGVEIVALPDDQYAVDMQAGEWLTYTINDVPSTGYYNVKAIVKSDATNKTVTLSNGSYSKADTVYGSAVDSYYEANIGNIYLTEGTNTIKLELTKGANIIFDTLLFYAADLELKETSGGATLSGNLNGVFGGKTTLCTLAIYEGNRLLKVASISPVAGNYIQEIELALTGITKANDKTYTVKAFIWDNMDGFVIQ